MAHSLAPSPSASTRLLGIVGIVGGLVLVAAFVPNLPWTRELFQLRLVLFNAGAIAVALAVHRRQAAVSRRLSLAVTVAVILANAWYLAMVVLSIGRPQFPAPDPEFRLVMFFAGVALWWADAAFGLVAWRLRAVTRWGALALAIGSILAFMGMDRLELARGDARLALHAGRAARASRSTGSAGSSSGSTSRSAAGVARRRRALAPSRVSLPDQPADLSVCARLQAASRPRAATHRST